MYELKYDICDKNYEVKRSIAQLFTTPEKALSAIKDKVANPDKVIFSDYSDEDVKEFRWLHLEAEDQSNDCYYYKLNVLYKTVADQPLE